MHDLCLINLIVGRGDGEAFLDFLGDQGIKTAHSLPCRGTAGKKLLDLLGLEESEKTLLWAMTSRARAGRLLARLVREMGLDMPGAGIAFTTPVGSVAGATSLRSLTEGQDIIMGEVTDMPASFLYELIIAIVNRGHADTVMDAARAAGAAGGTVLHAKGTGSKRGEKFFGVSLADEKDMVYIIAYADEKTAIMRAINENAGPGTKAGAICFSLPVSSVAGLRERDEE